MKIFKLGEAIIAQLFVLGIERVSYKHLNAIKARLTEILPEEFYIEVSYNLEDNALIYRPNSLERQEVAEIFIRGWANNPKSELLRIIKEQLYYLPFSELLIAKIGELDLEEIYGQIFTQEYVNEHYFWEIPEEYREDFIKICSVYTKEILAPSS